MASVIDMVRRLRVLYKLLGIICAVFFILSVAAISVARHIGCGIVVVVCS